MEDEADGKQDAPEANQPPPPPVAPINETPTPEKAASKPAAETETPEQKLDRDMVRWTCAVALLTGALVFVGICQIGAGLLQWQEMKSGGKQTGDLVIATQGLADAAHSQANNTAFLALSGGVQAGAMEKLRLAGEAQAKATGDLRDATQSESQSVKSQTEAVLKSLKVSQKIADANAQSVENFSNSERARFFFERASVSHKDNSDPAPVFTYSLVNLGRSGGLVIALSVECSVTDASVANIPKFNPGALKTAMSAVGPSATLSTGTTCTPSRPVTSLDYAAIASKREMFFLMGFVQYQDVFGARYTKRFGVYSFDGTDFFSPPVAAYNTEEKN